MTNKQKRTQKALKVASILGIIATIIFVVLLHRRGAFTDSEALAGYLYALGAWAPAIFVVVQIVQVVIPILPGGITLAAGVVVFGPVWGFVYNYVGIVIGSALNFLIARRYGKAFILSIVSKKTYDKYIGWVDKGSRFDRFFTLSILFPFAPDDILCLIAGLTKMSFKRFMTIILLGKPATIFIFSMGLTTVLNFIGGLF